MERLCQIKIWLEAQSIKFVGKSNLSQINFRVSIHNCYHRRLCRVQNMLAMYLKYHKAGLTPTTPVTSTAISHVNRMQIAY